jgi:hypothetical protein
MIYQEENQFPCGAEIEFHFLSFFKPHDKVSQSFKVRKGIPFPPFKERRRASTCHQRPPNNASQNINRATAFQFLICKRKGRVHEFSPALLTSAPSEPLASSCHLKASKIHVFQCNQFTTDEIAKYKNKGIYLYHEK